METVRFTPEQRKWILEVWVPALREGGYQQADGSLRSGDKYCCLGVACDLLGAEWEGRTNAGNILKEFVAKVGSSESIKMLPADARERIGINAEGGFAPAFEVCDDDDGYVFPYSSLVEMNDAGVSFEKIADVIEDVLLNPKSPHCFIR